MMSEYTWAADEIDQLQAKVSPHNHIHTNAGRG